VTRARTVLVTGATGRIGRLVVDELLRAGVHVRALTRHPDRAALPDAVELATGDFTAPDSIDPALEDVDAAFLVWTAPVDTAAAVIARLGAEPRRIVYLSAPFRTPHPFFQQPNPLRDLHAEIERLLAESGRDGAILRPGMFMSNALHWWAPQIRAGDVVRWPYADVETAPIDERDIAAVAARVLVDDTYANVDHVLTGPESLSQRAQLHAIGEAIGRQLIFEELSPDEFRRETEGTWPAGVADMLLSAWSAALGQPAFVTSAVEEILGVPARTVRDWALDNAAAFGTRNSPARPGRRHCGGPTDV